MNTKNTLLLSQSAIDELVVNQVDDDLAWEEPIFVQPQMTQLQLLVDGDLIPLLYQQAELKGVNLNKFVNDLLRSSLTNTA